VIQAAITHPQAVQALGHNVPRVFMLVFGIGSALAGLAGVIGGSTYLTDPAMAATMGPIVFVVLVVGGVGSLAGAFVASLLIGLLQTYAVSWNVPLTLFGLGNGMTLAQWAPVLPYVLMLAMLALRPAGLMGQRGEGR
jgi:branched-chain amino acid transport system permease protein